VKEITANLVTLTAAHDAVLHSNATLAFPRMMHRIVSPIRIAES